jgi:hypothetical protein
VLVCAVERGDEVIIPDGSFVLREGDHAYVTAPAQSLLTLVKVLALETVRIRSVLIVGGSRIAFYLPQMRVDAGIEVKLLENNLQRCNILSEELPSATVIHGDGTSFQTLMAEGLEETDALVALTNIDEQNLIVSMFANQKARAQGGHKDQSGRIRGNPAKDRHGVRHHAPASDRQRHFALRPRHGEPAGRQRAGAAPHGGRPRGSAGIPRTGGHRL